MMPHPLHNVIEKHIVDNKFHLFGSLNLRGQLQFCKLKPKKRKSNQNFNIFPLILIIPSRSPESPLFSVKIFIEICHAFIDLNGYLSFYRLKKLVTYYFSHPKQNKGN
uniref:Uncharacterized protein n=1 Tax=Opuntia streptacantha TaxID=393608 RepID=A0A7C8Z8G1_OPUST